MDEKVNMVKEWLTFASRDINSAKFLFGMNPVPLEIICYHSQQAAEKALKAYLIYKNVEAPRTHNLGLLCNLCMDIDKTFDELIVPCGKLMLYGVQPRYPYELEITEYDARKAVVDADRVMEFILQRIRCDTGDGSH